jgi:hypothetical protein
LLISGAINLTEKIAAFTRNIPDGSFRDVCSVAGNLYVTVKSDNSMTLRKFIRGSYLNNENSYLTSIPVNA